MSRQGSEIRDLNPECLTDRHAEPWPNQVPFETRQGQILAGRTWHDWVAFPLQCQDAFQRIEAQRPVRSSVVFEVPLAITVGAGRLHRCLGHGQFGYAAVGDIDLKEVGTVVFIGWRRGGGGIDHR